MQIQISSNIEVTPAIQTYVEKKFKKFEKYSEQITNVKITFTIEKKIHKANVYVVVPGADLFAEVSSDDLYKTVDLLEDKIVKQLNKRKETLQQI